MTRVKDPPGTPKTCRSCGAEIVWVITSSGKSMPCDLAPVPDGTFFLFRRPDRIEAVSVKSSQDPRAPRAMARGDKRYTSHFATCPQAAEHRRG